MTLRAIEHKIVMEHITQLGKPKPAPKAKKAKNPRINKPEWLAYRSQRGWGFACDSGSGKPGHILHHCIIGRRAGHPELDDYRNYALVNAEDDSKRMFDNREWRMFFWGLNVKRFGLPAMLEWVNSLPPKMRSRVDWL